MANILLKSLDNYYSNGTNMEQFNDYVNGKKKNIIKNNRLVCN